ncbi:MAG: thrombospondin type 3 repeat-containing protein, partial [Myxococcales bacterium]|nr:thrombospondin type 3 repeat-containing protein [Myxococcales bacterium]
MSRVFARSRGARSAVVVAAVLLTVALVPEAAQAQRAGAFSVLRFRPGTSALSLLHTDTPKTLGHLVPSAGLYVHYDHQPLVFVDAQTDEMKHAEVSYQLNTQLVASLGLWDRFEVGIAIPLAIGQGVGDPDTLNKPEDLAGGIGDMRLVLKADLYSTGPLRLGLVAPILLPTGDANNYLGDDGIGFEPRIAASLEYKRFSIYSNIAFRIRPEKNVEPALTTQSISVNNEASLYIGGRYGLLPEKLDIIVDWYGALNVTSFDATERAGEILAGVRYYLPHGLQATLAGGPGIGIGMGVPTFRVIAHIGWKPVGDSDGDGLKNPVDKCPNKPEDKDGFEDKDGCPDLDNDKDGIPDTKDKCPNKPEDKDGFEDIDGCPDPDNDKDGLPDGKDKCPNKPEDKDKFEDTDGCPDPDNDLDGVPDVKDKCPNTPEGPVDGWKDDDGCPDPDNDEDGIPDEKDKCPNEPETFNKYNDTDGCPDVAKRTKVRIMKDSIKVPPVFFAVNKDVILKKSFKNLKLVAELLAMNKWVK